METEIHVGAHWQVRRNDNDGEGWEPWRAPFGARVDGDPEWAEAIEYLTSEPHVVKVTVHCNDGKDTWRTQYRYVEATPCTNVACKNPRHAANDEQWCPVHGRWAIGNACDVPDESDGRTTEGAESDRC